MHHLRAWRVIHKEVPSCMALPCKKGQRGVRTVLVDRPLPEGDCPLS